MHVSVLRSLAESLSNAAVVDWEDGEIEDWVEWARSMKDAISVSASAMNAIADELQNTNSFVGELQASLKAKDELIAKLSDALSNKDSTLERLFGSLLDRQFPNQQQKGAPIYGNEFPRGDAYG